MQQIPGFASALIFPSRGVVNLDRREGAKNGRRGFHCTDELGGFHGVIRPHREIIADAQCGKFQRCGFANEFHVQRQRGVAGVIKIAFARSTNKAAGIPAERAVGHRAGMDGIHEFGAAKSN